MEELPTPRGLTAEAGENGSNSTPVAQNVDEGITAILTEFYSGTKSTAEKRGRGRPKSNHWRLDFSPDNGIIRARLRRGSGRNRANVKDENGIIIERHFMPLGKIEDVYGNKTFRQWHKRCEQYASRTGYTIATERGGSGDRNVDRTPEAGVAGITLDKWSGFELHQPARTDQ
jgi:hypothetical protein